MCRSKFLSILLFLSLCTSGCALSKAVGGVAGFARDTVVVTTKTTGEVASGIVVGTGQGTGEIIKSAGKMVQFSAKGVTEPASGAVVGTSKAVASSAATAGVKAAEVAAENPELAKKIAEASIAP